MYPFVDILATIGLIWYGAIGSISLAGWYCTLFIYNRPSGSADEISDESASESASLTRSHALGVSILRPLSGLEPELYQCLESAFKQSSSVPFEVILSVKLVDDPAVEIARRVIAAHPGVDSTLIIGDVDVGVNPKINNLVKSFEASKYPIIWILDSNTWISSGTLDRSARHFADDKVNLVHHVPVAHASLDAETGSLLDDVYLATMHAKMYAIINYLSVAPCVMGKSNLIRKSELPEHGLQSFGKFIAEDHLMAVALWKGRNTHVLGSDCVRQPLQGVTWHQYVARRIRWVRVRIFMVTAATLIEPITECMPLGFIGAVSLAGLYGISWYKTWFAHCLFWMAMDYISWNSLRNHPHDEYPPFSPSSRSRMSLTRWIGIWLLRETTALPIWCLAMSSNRIDWRGSQFVINKDMTARRVLAD